MLKFKPATSDQCIEHELPAGTLVAIDSTGSLIAEIDARQAMYYISLEIDAPAEFARWTKQTITLCRDYPTDANRSMAAATAHCMPLILGCEITKKIIGGFHD